MHDTLNPLGQPIGLPVTNWQAPSTPARKVLTGRFCRLEPLDPSQHAADLFTANALDETGLNWTYLPYGPFASLAEYRSWLEDKAGSSDPLFFAVIDPLSNKAVGLAAYLRIDPANGSIEVGHLCFSPLLQRTPAATEAMWLMMAEAFALGYRRYEWKCNALNLPSRAAAKRLGLSYEGVFRQAAVVKGHNRDTAWYAAIDQEWPALNQAFQHWLAADNFTVEGQQKRALSQLTAPLLVTQG
jgi:RimJ/RimL family protein N-acetyltransferase